MKQETIKEAAEKEYPTVHEKYQYDAFIEGAKWQMEKSYSEEEVMAMLKELEIECVINPKRIDIKQWFEQFKTK